MTALISRLAEDLDTELLRQRQRVGSNAVRDLEPERLVEAVLRGLAGHMDTAGHRTAATWLRTSINGEMR